MPRTGVVTRRKRSGVTYVLLAVAVLGLTAFAAIRHFAPQEAMYGYVSAGVLSSRYTGSALLVREAVEPIVDALALAIQETVQDAPDELSADLLRSGVILTGGGALLSGLDRVLASRCGLSCHIPETPGLCTGKGMARILQDPVLSDLAVRKM